MHAAAARANWIENGSFEARRGQADRARPWTALQGWDAENVYEEVVTPLARTGRTVLAAPGVDADRYAQWPRGASQLVAVPDDSSSGGLETVVRADLWLYWIPAAGDVGGGGSGSGSGGSGNLSGATVLTVSLAAMDAIGAVGATSWDCREPGV